MLVTSPPAHLGIGAVIVLETSRLEFEGLALAHLLDGVWSDFLRFGR